MTQEPSAIKDYKTSPGRISLFSRTFPGLKFYSFFVRLVFNAGINAKKGRYDNAAWRQNSLDLLYALESIGINFEISGFDHIKHLPAPYVIIANHMSTLETVALPSIFLPFTNVTFIVKQSLLNYPFFGHILRARNPISVNRASARQDLKTVMEEGKNRLERNISVIVFPQTTRTLYLDPRQFNTIGVKLAQRTGVPIVPVALKTDAWGNGKYLRDFGRIDPSKKVHFAIGKPIRIKERGREEHEAVVRFINEKLQEWKNTG